MSSAFTNDHHRWARRAAQRYGKGKQFYLDLIEEQCGLCGFSNAPLLFDADNGTPEKGKRGPHPLYASFEHSAPGRDDCGHRIVCYALNDVKGKLPYDCFRALEDTYAWKRLMQAWNTLARKEGSGRDSFKELLDNWPSSHNIEFSVKLVQMIVPRTITRTMSSATQRHVKRVRVDAESILKALTINDYHENWYFPDPESVKVLSVEDSPEGSPGTPDPTRNRSD